MVRGWSGLVRVCDVCYKNDTERRESEANAQKKSARDRARQQAEQIVTIQEVEKRRTEIENIDAPDIAVSEKGITAVDTKTRDEAAAEKESAEKLLEAKPAAEKAALTKQSGRKQQQRRQSLAGAEKAAAEKALQEKATAEKAYTEDKLADSHTEIVAADKAKHKTEADPEIHMVPSEYKSAKEETTPSKPVAVGTPRPHPPLSSGRRSSLGFIKGTSSHAFRRTSLGRSPLGDTSPLNFVVSPHAPMASPQGGGGGGGSTPQPLR